MIWTRIIQEQTPEPGKRIIPPRKVSPPPGVPGAAEAPGQNENEAPTPVPQQQNLANLQQVGQLSVPQPESTIQTITIIGQVEGHVVLPPQNKTTKYEHILPQLVAIEQNPKIEGLLLILNTVGGDVEAGLAIAEMVASMTKPTVSLVLGGGHSIGVPISVASQYSFIAETATMTVHPIRLTGLIVGVPQSFEYLDKMQERVVRFSVANSKISAEKFRELMFRTGDLARDIGTVLIGHEAVDVGLIDQVGGIGDALAKLESMIKQRREASE